MFPPFYFSPYFWPSAYFPSGIAPAVAYHLAPFGSTFYPDAIGFALDSYPLDAQGAVIPTPGSASTYRAAVRPMTSTQLAIFPNVDANGTEMMVRLPYNPADALIPALVKGCQATFGGRVFTVLGKALARTSMNQPWRIGIQEVV